MDERLETLADKRGSTETLICFFESRSSSRQVSKQLLWGDTIIREIEFQLRVSAIFQHFSFPTSVIFYPWSLLEFKISLRLPSLKLPFGLKFPIVYSFLWSANVSTGANRIKSIVVNILYIFFIRKTLQFSKPKRNKCQIQAYFYSYRFRNSVSGSSATLTMDWDRKIRAK